MIRVLVVVATLILAGCASQAQINVPQASGTELDKFSNKSVGYEVLHSSYYLSFKDPLPYTPYQKVLFDKTRYPAFVNLEDLLYSAVPTSRRASDFNDYRVVMKVKSHQSKGPTYDRLQFFATLFMKTITLGMAYQEWEIIANFDIQYTLYDSKDNVVHEKLYVVKDRVDHAVPHFESDYNGEYNGKLFKKHVALTLNDFLYESNRIL